MKTTEILYALVVAVIALHFFFMWKFWRKTPKRTKFSIIFWIKDNMLQYIFAWMGMVLWLMLFEWDKILEYYNLYIVAKIPVLAIIKAHALVAFLAGFFNTKAFAWGAKKLETKLNLKK